MAMKSRVAVVSLLVVLVSAVSFQWAEGQAPEQEPAKKSDSKGAEKPKFVEKTDKEWAKILTNAQYMVLRRKATEPAFSGKFVNNHAKGIYACAGCGEELFRSTAKFDSGTGWPSFYAPVRKDKIATQMDYSDPAEVRVEVECAVCGGHLGHVFSDGPPPTGLRYCINSASLKFAKDPVPAPKAKAKTKTKAKATTAKDAENSDPTASPVEDETPKVTPKKSTTTKRP